MLVSMGPHADLLGVPSHHLRTIAFCRPSRPPILPFLLSPASTLHSPSIILDLPGLLYLSILLHSLLAPYAMDREGGFIPWSSPTSPQPSILGFTQRFPSHLLRFFHRHIVQYSNSHSMVLPTCSETYQAGPFEFEACKITTTTPVEEGPMVLHSSWST